MKLYPAIDLMNGQCVRLHKGDFDTQKTYSVDPVSMARDFQTDGARTLHIVDLDGAKNPEDRQLDLIKQIIAQTGINIQTGGGIRSLSDIDTLLNIGAKRVIVGSMAVKDKAATMDAFKQFGTENICLALDVKKGADDKFYIATSGWQETSDVLLDELIAQYIDAGLTHALCTDIDKDGTLQGPNMELYSYLASNYPDIHIQASGGISDLADLIELQKTGASGVIVGKAIYENAFSVRQALAIEGIAA